MNGPAAPDIGNPAQESIVASPTPHDLAVIEQYSDAPLPEGILPKRKSLDGLQVDESESDRSMPVLELQDAGVKTMTATTENRSGTSLADVTAEPLHPSVPAPLVYPLVERTEPNNTELAPPQRIARLNPGLVEVNSLTESQKPPFQQSDGAATTKPARPKVVLPSNRPQIQADSGTLVDSAPSTTDHRVEKSNTAKPASSDLQLRPPRPRSAPSQSNGSNDGDSESSTAIENSNDATSIAIDTEQLFADSDLFFNGSDSKQPQESTAAAEVAKRSVSQLSPPLAPELIQNRDETGVSTTEPKLNNLVEKIARRVNADSKPEPENRTVEIDPNSDHAREPSLDNPATWPITASLSTQLSKLAQWDQLHSRTLDGQLVSSRPSSLSPMSEWSGDVESHLRQLRLSDRLGDDDAGTQIEHLERLSVEGARAAEKLLDRNQQIAWLRAAYAVNRRVAVWKPIWSLSSQSSNQTAMVPTATSADVATAIDSAKSALSTTGDLKGWSDYLLLDQLASAAASDEPAVRAAVARRVLTRMNNNQLGAIQRHWMQRPEIQTLADSIRPWSRTPVDYAALLGQIEKTESNHIDLVTSDVAETMQALRFANHPAAMDVSAMIDTHYRNANVRVALSQDFLQRMIPELPSRSLPVRTRMLGSQVTGVSDISSDLSIRLVPARDRWSVLLQTLGNVRTRSVGRKGPAAVSTLGANQFTASTPIQITPTGVNVGGSNVHATGRTRLRGVRTNYDGWPLIGDLIRSFAEGQYQEQSGIAQRLSNRHIERNVVQEVDRGVSEKVDEMSNRFSEMVLGPLNRLDLEPQVIDLETTNTRLIARYRMANDLQLAAFTPRPRAPSDSLMSVQVHQSALNNTMQQLIVHQEPTPLPQIVDECLGLLGIEPVELPSDIPSDVQIRFAKHRPITFEITEGKIWLTMRVIRLERGERMKLSNFIVRAAYRPQISGLSAVLVREGHLSISGPGMSMRQRLPVRAIFNKVLSSNRPLPLTSNRLAELPGTDKLVISQLEVRDGWLSMAIGPMLGESPQPSTYISDDRIANRQE